MTRCSSVPSTKTVGGDGSLFDLSNIGWDQDSTRSRCGGDATAPRPPSLADVFGSVASIDSVSMCPPPMSSPLRGKSNVPGLPRPVCSSVPNLLRRMQPYSSGMTDQASSSQTYGKRKLSVDSENPPGFKVNILKKLTRRKSPKLSGSSQPVAADCSVSTVTLKRRPSIRESIRNIFSKKR